MSVTFSIFVQSPKTWIIECSCAEVTAVSSYASYQETLDALNLGVAPSCEDEYCAAYPCSITTAEDAELEVSSLNVTNVNAKFILGVLDLLSYELDENGEILLDADGQPFLDLCGTTSAQDVLNRVLLAQDVEPHDAGVRPTEKISLREEVLADSSLAVSQGARIFDMGRREGYLDERLAALKALALRAQELNASITWS